MNRSPHASCSPGMVSLLVVAAAVAAACDAVAPTAAPTGDVALSPDQAQAQASACHGVRFDMWFSPHDLEADPPEYTATFSGDLEGTADILLLGPGTPFTGVTNTAIFQFIWNVTGGVVPELIGESFVTHADNRNLVFAHRFPRVAGTHRVESGVSRANLTYQGEVIEVTWDPFWFQTLLHHNGVICL